VDCSGAPSAARICVTADRLYAILLRLYPASFRARFGDDMRRSFGHDWTRARAEGGRSRALFWIRTIAEALVYGPAERCRPAPRAARPELAAKGHLMTGAILHDCRDAFRALRGTPLVAAVAILSLALGVGANTALFSILNGLVLKPLPVREPGSLMLL